MVPTETRCKEGSISLIKSVAFLQSRSLHTNFSKFLAERMNIIRKKIKIKNLKTFRAKGFKIKWVALTKVQ